MRIMRRGKEENASGCGKCIVEWSGGELKWSGVEVEWKWSGLNRFSSFSIFDFFDFRFRGHSAIHREEEHIHIHIWMLVSISGS